MILDDNGGRLAGSEYWGLRTLAYRIKKNRKGHYVMLRVDAPAAAMHELERNLRLSDDVIRYLTVRSEEHTSELQSLMRISYAVFCLKKKKLSNTKRQSKMTLTM